MTNSPFMINLYTRLLLLSVVLWPFRSLAQAPDQADMQKALDQYRREHLQEKVFVHTDKDLYLAGEICWFKLYVVEAASHRPLDLSKVAYLEWLDKDNKPVLQAKIGLDSGHGDGSVYLPLTLHSGNYTLRAYTNWMKNYGPDWFFEKPITVVNARREADAPLPDSTMGYRIAFFPEGGSLVEGLSSKVAFHITDRYGKGVGCAGVVMEDDQDTIVRCSPYRFGIGDFVLKPRSGHHYRAIFRLAGGTVVQSLLPSAAREGMVMGVTLMDDNGHSAGSSHYHVEVQSTSDGSPVYLLAINRTSVRAAQTAMLQDHTASFMVDRAALGDGIIQLTLFNAARQPLCERLVFNYPTRSLHIALQADKESYGTRQKIDLHIDARGAGGGPLPADCSVSVFRVDSLTSALDSLTRASNDHIAPYLWLTSDLKGTIESPGYYFMHPDDRQAMDNLMLTNGWRRYRWEDVLHPAPLSFTFPPEYQGAILSGRVVDARTGAAATKPIQAYLSVPGGRTQFTSALCDEEGKIRFELKDFYGGQEVIVQTNPLRDSSYRVELSNPFAENYSDDPRHIAPLTLSTSDAGSLTDRAVDMQVLNRYIGERLKRSHLPAADTTPFYDKADYSYLLDNYVRFTTMEEVMREYVVLMLVKHQEGHFHLPIFNLPYNDFFEEDPLILLDGVPIFNIDSLMALDPLKVKKLETMQRRVFMGPVNFPGIMNWTTYKGDLGGYILDPHATVVDYEGLQMEREFYSPSYETEAERSSHLPDFRNVLFWAPDAPVGLKSGGALSFYSSDIPGRYIVVAEGIAPDGTAGSGMTTFVVK